MSNSSRVTYTATAHALNTLSVNNNDLPHQTDEIPHDVSAWWGDDTKVGRPPESATVGFSNDIEDGTEEWLLERLEIENIARDKRFEATDVSFHGLVEGCETTEVVTVDRNSAQCADVSSESQAWHSPTFAAAITSHIFDETDVTTEDDQTQAAKTLAEESNWWHDEALVALLESSGRPPQPEQAKNTVNGGKPTALEPIVVTEIAEEASGDAPSVPREPPVANIKEENGSTQEGRAASLSGYDDELAGEELIGGELTGGELTGEELTGEAEERSEGRKVTGVTGVMESESTPSPFGVPIAIEDFEDLRVLLQQHDLALEQERRRLYRPRH